MVHGEASASSTTHNTAYIHYRYVKPIPPKKYPRAIAMAIAPLDWMLVGLCIVLLLEYNRIAMTHRVPAYPLPYSFRFINIKGFCAPKKVPKDPPMLILHFHARMPYNFHTQRNIWCCNGLEWAGALKERRMPRGQIPTEQNKEKIIIRVCASGMCRCCCVECIVQNILCFPPTTTHHHLRHRSNMNEFWCFNGTKRPPATLSPRIRATFPSPSYASLRDWLCSAHLVHTPLHRRPPNLHPPILCTKN